MRDKVIVSIFDLEEKSKFSSEAPAPFINLDLRVVLYSTSKC